ncbi:unnamed protein product [Amoebophrya sp. A120]|nr:unnamed protein product [Amoebophrya sp. A120]|eukprot:GSA120T00023916001.1
MDTFALVVCASRAMGFDRVATRAGPAGAVPPPPSWVEGRSTPPGGLALWVGLFPPPGGFVFASFATPTPPGGARLAPKLPSAWGRLRLGALPMEGRGVFAWLLASLPRRLRPPAQPAAGGASVCGRAPAGPTRQSRLAIGCAGSLGHCVARWLV